MFAVFAPFAVKIPADTSVENHEPRTTGTARTGRADGGHVPLPVDADLGEVDVDDLDPPRFSKPYPQKRPVALTAMVAE